MHTRRRFGAGLCPIVIAATSYFVAVTPGFGQAATPTPVQRCTSLKASDNADGKIAACSAVIDSRSETPNNRGIAYNSRALAWEAKGNLDRAIADYTEAVRLVPKDPVIFRNRGIAWRSKGDLDRSIADLGEAIKLNPTNSQYYNSRALTWEGKNDYDRAVADYNEAIRLAPKDPVFYRNRGLAWRSKGDLDRAIADLSEAINLNPNNAQYYTDRGVVLRRKGELDRAIADHDQAIRLDPNYAVAFNNRAFAYRQKNDLDRAISDYDQAIRLNPRYLLALLNRGHAWRAKRDTDRAINDYSEVIRIDPTYTTAYTSRGLTYESRGDVERARSDFNAAIAIPGKEESAKGAQETARQRLAILATAPQTPPPPTVAPSVSPPPVVASLPTAADSGRRVALVIGNGRYAHASELPNPANDARAVSQTLREIGFEVNEGVDLDRSGMERLVRDFLRGAATARVALLFYAGHGMQVDGRNYLVPIDAKLERASDLAFETVEIDKILAALDDETRANIIILDACRDNPLARTFASRTGRTRSGAVSSGLAAYSTLGTGTLIAYATAPGAVALDGQGVNSPFTTALVKHIRTPGVEVRNMLTRVRADVAKVTQNKQIPWDNSSLLGEVYLSGGSSR